MEPVNVFNSVEYMEKKCPKCSSKIDFGITTEWDDKAEAHKCKSCGEIIK